MICSSPAASSRCRVSVAPRDIGLFSTAAQESSHDRCRDCGPRLRPYKKGTREAVTHTASDAVGRSGTQSMNSCPHPSRQRTQSRSRREECVVISQDGDSVTIRGAPLLAALYRGVLQAIQRRRLDGLPSADLQQLARALRRAQDVATGTPIVQCIAEFVVSSGQDDDLISVGEAAGLLQLSRRHVARLAAGPGGLGAVRIGRTWALRRSIVLALAKERAHDRRANGLSGRAGDRPAHRHLTPPHPAKQSRWPSTRSLRRCRTTSSARSSNAPEEGHSMTTPVDDRYPEAWRP